MLWFQQTKKNIFILALIVLFCVPVVLPLFHPGFFQSDDGEWMIIRFSAFHEALRDGQFPVRFLSRLNYGYGYPVANFLYPLFMYLGVPIHVVGFGFVDTIKIILGLSMVGSGFFCFLWLSKIFNKFCAFVGAMFYLYLPYHLYDLYKRGSVGEILALAVIPFALLQVERKSFFWLTVSLSALILSHNTLAIIFLPIIVFYMFIKKDFPLRSILITVILGLGISSFFWFPALFDLQYTVFSKTKISEWQNYFADVQIISYLSLVVLFVAILMAIKKRVKGIAIFFLTLGIVSLFLATPISTFIWEVLPISFIQFPFRFLSVEILAIAYLASFILTSMKGVIRFALGATLIILVIAISIQYRPSVFFDKGDSYYATNEDSTTVKNEYLPIWVKNNPREHYKSKAEIIDGVITNLSIRPNSIGFDATSPEATAITINTIYFPGWKAYVDSNNTTVNYDNEKGVMNISMPAGIHRITTYFFETPIRLASDIVSAVSALILLIIVLNREKRKEYERLKSN